LYRVHRGRRRVLAPDRVGQPAGADDLAAVQRQHRQHRLAPQAADRSWIAIDHDVDRPKKTNLHDFSPAVQ
jgi:hypothetical protein